MIGTKSLLVMLLVVSPVIAASGRKEVSYEKDIQPILQANCAMCHVPNGVGYTTSGFSVQTYDTVMKGTKYGPIVNPGSSVSSNLVWVLEHRADHTINMPKVCEQAAPGNGKCIRASQAARILSGKELTWIIEWIDEGAKNN
ncbi:MAG: hypothetical protein KGJ66_11110 [Alphaproteobacteria bacterium]|nr:hypothetical protein [Alphaproteobacteria bacterium]